VRVLAALVAGGLSLRAALRQWPRELAEPERSALLSVSRRLRLGDSIVGALGSAASLLADDLAALTTALELHSRLGGDPVRTLEGIAAIIDRRAELEQSSRAAAAGARLSGRIVAGLCLVAVAALPFQGKGVIEPGGTVLAAAGACLVVAGLAWIERLVPRPPPDDPAAAVAGLVSGVLRSGLPLGAALAGVAERPPSLLSAPAQRARRLASLGAPWPEALARSGDESLAALAEVLSPAQAAGMPAADSLERFAERRRRELLAGFEASVRRAPVLMVVPLTLLVLPAYVLAALAPFLRGL
jgi:Flp pilus assembly protein TadB